MSDFDQKKLMELAQQLLGGDANLSDMMGKAQQMMSKTSEIKEKLAEQTYEATVGGGIVTAKVRGDLSVERVSLDPRCVDPRDVEMLEDLISVAVNEAMSKAKKAYEEELSSMTGGMNLPFQP